MVLDSINKNKIDIALLQETHFNKNNMNKIKTEWGKDCFHSYGTSSSCGVTIKINKQLNYELISEYSDLEGRLLVVVIKLGELMINLVNCYAPNGDCPNFFEQMIDKLEEVSNNDVTICGGDFNLVLNPEQDRLDSLYNPPKSSKIVQNYIEKAHLVDTWRMINPDLTEFTWSRLKGIHPCASRIDLILMPLAWANRITSSVIKPFRCTDHKMVCTSFKLDNIQRGPGTWKFNNTLLSDIDFINEMNLLLDLISPIQKILNPTEMWLYAKKEITSLARNYSKNKANLHRTNKNNLNKLLETLTAEFNKGCKDANLLTEIKRINDALDCIATQETNAVIFRSKAKWVREGERNSKYFFALEKKKYLAKNMPSMLLEDGSILTDQKSILCKQSEFYEKLYTSNPRVKFDIPIDPATPVLNETDRKMLDSSITEAELFDACMTLKSNKTPGVDGLTIEFYRRFWKKLSPMMLSMYCDSFQNGCLPLSTRRGLISLLPKKGKDTRKIENLRPLTLLNNDYKILAKAIDNRISPMLPLLINKDQTGFVKGRNISYNIRKTLDIMNYCNNLKIPALIMSCNMNKCFDRIEHRSVYTALERMGFGENIIKWVSLFYTRFQFCTHNYGLLSDWMAKGCGVNQGCPVSPSIYLCIGKAMANAIRNNVKVHGIKIGNIEYLLSQFADDTDIYLPYDQEIVNTVLEILTDIENSTGLMISYDKTTLYRIGSIANSDAKFYTVRPVRWTNDAVNTLGIDLHKYEDLEKNLENTICKLKVICKMWYHRSMSLIGKVTIVNTLMSSLFIYKFQSIANVTESLYKQYEDTIVDFIWSGKKPKLPLNTLYCTLENGGLKLTDIRTRHLSLLCKWVGCCRTDEIIHNLVDQNINTYGNEVWKYNLNSKDFVEVSSKGEQNFWTHVGKAWASVNYHKPESYEDVRNQFICLNSLIRVRNKPIPINNNWPTRVRDIVKDDGEFRSFKEVAEQYPLIKWLDYLSILSAIPAQWKEILKFGDKLKDSRKPIEIMLNTISSKNCYRLINDKRTAVVKSFQQWSDKIRLNSITVFKECFRNIHRTTNIVKLRSFQYRLLHNKIFCNDILFHWKKVSSQKCDYCEHKQTIIHLMYYCKNARSVWDKVMEFLDDHGFNIKLDPESIILNNTKIQMVDFVILVVKQLLFRHKCNGTELTWDHVKAELNLLYKIELHNAMINNKLAKHVNKWKFIKANCMYLLESRALHTDFDDYEL